MAKIPNLVKGNPLPGLSLLSQGKVRDTYGLPDYPDNLLPVASDRISIFDHVLAALVEGKGAILTAMNVFWRAEVLKGFEHDLVAFGTGIDKFLPEALRGRPELQARALVIRKLEMDPVERIVRGVLTGSSVEPYMETGMVCGHRLPPGLHDGSKLPFSIFTPTTKEEEGHDVHITADSVAEKYGVMPERISLQAYTQAAEFAAGRGILLADTKFEGVGSVIADEVLTPDSSRYWSIAAWIEAQKKGKLPQAYDKEFVRTWGKEIGINKRDPKKPEDVAWVHDQIVPQDVLAQTTRLYRYIFWRLTGMMLEWFQKEKMDIAVEPPHRRIDVVLGSRHDLGQVLDGVRLTNEDADIQVHVCSCHRNPDELRNYAKKVAQEGKVDVIVAGAGKAAQLPGVLKAYLVAEGALNIPVIGVGFTGLDEAANLAAAISIEQLPGQPVELDEDGRAYAGNNGMIVACEAAAKHEFLPRGIAAVSAEWNIELPARSDD